MPKSDESLPQDGRTKRTLLLNGDEVRRRRQLMDLSQEAFSALADISEDSLSKAERGVAVSPRIAARIAKALNVMVESLVVGVSPSDTAKPTPGDDAGEPPGEPIAAASGQTPNRPRDLYHRLVGFGRRNWFAVLALPMLLFVTIAACIELSAVRDRNLDQAAATATELTHGARPDWSPDARRIIALSEQLSAQIVAETRHVTPPVPKEIFADAENTIAEISRLDPHNGAVYYFSAVIERYTEPRSEFGEQSHNDLFMYLDYEGRLPAYVTRNGDGLGACYEQPYGYCRERTAYIQHMLALDYMRKSAVTKDPIARALYLRHAVNYAKACLALRPAGFDQGTPTISIAAQAGSPSLSSR